jgi:hypothetical protein
MNIGCFKEAAEHFLVALSNQALMSNQNQQNVSFNLWNTLRKNFLLVYKLKVDGTWGFSSIGKRSSRS